MTFIGGAAFTGVVISILHFGGKRWSTYRAHKYQMQIEELEDARYLCKERNDCAPLYEFYNWQVPEEETIEDTSENAVSRISNYRLYRIRP